MYVIKRDGSRASVSFDKITSRITKLCYGLDPKVRWVVKSYGWQFETLSLSHTVSLILTQ